MHFSLSTLSLVFFLLIFFGGSVEAVAACVALPSAPECQNGGQAYVDDATNILYKNAVCTNPCDCPDAVDVCYGCDYMATYSNSDCYSDTSCTIPCVPIPELSSFSSTAILWGFVLLMLIYGAKGRPTSTKV